MKATPKRKKTRRRFKRKRPSTRHRRIAKFNGVRTYRLYPFHQRNNETFSFFMNLRKITAKEDQPQSLSCTWANLNALVPEDDGHRLRTMFDSFSILRFGTIIELPQMQKPGKFIPKIYYTYDPDLQGRHMDIDSFKKVQTTRVAVMTGRRHLKLSFHFAHSILGEQMTKVMTPMTLCLTQL